jgi:hypothetical protein
VPHGVADLIDLATAQVAAWARDPAGGASDGAAPAAAMPDSAGRHEAAA